MPAIVIGPGDLGSCLLIPHREREIPCQCKCQSRRIIEQLPERRPCLRLLRKIFEPFYWSLEQDIKKWLALKPAH